MEGEASTTTHASTEINLETSGLLHDVDFEAWEERQRQAEEDALLRAIAEAKAGLEPWEAEPSPQDTDAALANYQSGSARISASPLTALGVDLGAVDSEIDVETELQKYQAKVKKSVQNDIKKMLMSTKAYVKYHSPPPVASQAKTKLLAAPKPSLTHPETLLARRLEDPTEYAKVKARQLAAKRVITERVEAAKAQEKTQQAHQIKAYQQHKELKAAHEAAVKQEAARVEQQYSKDVSKFLREKALHDLEAHKAKVQAQKATAQALHEKLSQRGFC